MDQLELHVIFIRQPQKRPSFNWPGGLVFPEFWKNTINLDM